MDEKVEKAHHYMERIKKTVCEAEVCVCVCV